MGIFILSCFYTGPRKCARVQESVHTLESEILHLNPIPPHTSWATTCALWTSFPHLENYEFTYITGLWQQSYEMKYTRVLYIHSNYYIHYIQYISIPELATCQEKYQVIFDKEFFFLLKKWRLYICAVPEEKYLIPWTKYVMLLDQCQTFQFHKLLPWNIKMKFCMQFFFNIYIPILFIQQKQFSWY